MALSGAIAYMGAIMYCASNGGGCSTRRLGAGQTSTVTAGASASDSVLPAVAPSRAVSPLTKPCSVSMSFSRSDFQPAKLS
jgi:hypothetical protein